MYREIAGTDEGVRANPGVRDRRVRATKVRLYNKYKNIMACRSEQIFLKTQKCNEIADIVDLLFVPEYRDKTCFFLFINICWTLRVVLKRKPEK